LFSAQATLHGVQIVLFSAKEMQLISAVYQPFSTAKAKVAAFEGDSNINSPMDCA